MSSKGQIQIHEAAEKKLGGRIVRRTGCAGNFLKTVAQELRELTGIRVLRSELLAERCHVRIVLWAAGRLFDGPCMHAPGVHDCADGACGEVTVEASENPPRRSL